MRKDLILAVICTFCLTVTLFTIIPIRSQTTPEYDPWKDINDDGYIGIDDIVSVAESFGALGDPTKNVNVTNWPDELNVNVTNWQQSQVTEKQVGWLKYLGQHSLSNAMLVPQEAGQIGPEKLSHRYSAGDGAFSYTYYTLGKVNLNIPRGKEIIAKITLSQDSDISLLNLTLEVGYTDKTNYTVLVKNSWAGSEGLPSSPQGYTIELGSLNSDVTITDKYLYFKIYVKIHSAGTWRYVYYWTRNDMNDVCLLIPYN